MRIIIQPNEAPGTYEIRLGSEDGPFAEYDSANKCLYRLQLEVRAVERQRPSRPDEDKE